MAEPTNIGEALRVARRPQLVRALESDPRVRDWLSKALVGTAEAAEILGVERGRLWRWENAGKIKSVVKVQATPLFLRTEVEQLKRDLEAEAKAKAERRAAV